MCISKSHFEVKVLYQLERQGYYAIDPDSDADKLVLNLTVSLREIDK